MSSIGKPERATQNRVIALFRDELGYRFLVNGIAVGMLELKNSRVSIGDGIRHVLSSKSRMDRVVSDIIWWTSSSPASTRRPAPTSTSTSPCRIMASSWRSAV